MCVCVFMIYNDFLNVYCSWLLIIMYIHVYFFYYIIMIIIKLHAANNKEWTERLKTNKP